MNERIKEALEKVSTKIQNMSIEEFSERLKIHRDSEFALAIRGEWTPPDQIDKDDLS